jgi:uncharacterized protein (TIRG00374 family)
MCIAKAPDRAINWKLWAGLLISALFLYMAFRQADPVKTWELIRKADISMLFLAVLITSFHYLIRAWRWRIFLDPVRETSFSSRLSSLMIGFAANCILPARLGEFIRANYIGHTSGVSRSAAFGTIVIERLFDGFTLLMFLLIGLLATTFPTALESWSGSIRLTGIILFLASILLVLLLAGFKYKAEFFLKLLERLLFFLPSGLLSKIIRLVHNFTAGLALLNDRNSWVMGIFYSLLLWSTALFQIMLIAWSIGLDLPFMSTFLIMAMAFFGVMIPSAPGYIGTFHLSVQYGFMFSGIGGEEALSAAVLWHASSYFPTIIFGLISFLYVQSSFEKVSDKT